MATTGRNIDFPIYSDDGTPFENLVLRKATYESVVMSLGDKITGDVYYKNNSLNVTMREYIELDGVKFALVNPPTIVRDGVVSSGDAKGMTKYSFEFYHPMQKLSNIPFTDIAVTDDEEQYLSQNKTFSWIGYPDDFFAKLNKNLEGTQWVVTKSDKFPNAKDEQLSEVLSFDNNTIADALSRCYETWEVPFVIDKVSSDDDLDNEKEFKIIFGLPAEEIYASPEDRQSDTPYVFSMGQGVGLKNNSRSPRNNKIITRISGFGSEDNIPYGYPQILWEGDPNAKFTIGDSIGIKENVTINGKTYAKAISYPIYKGIVGGEWVNLIKHPFTRGYLMPSIYRETVNNKVNPYAEDYNPQEVIIDYYDAIASQEYPYVNEIVENAPSFEVKQFEKIKPELGEAYIVDAKPTDVTVTNVTTITNGSDNFIPTELVSQADFHTFISDLYNIQKDYDDDSDWYECRQILHAARQYVASDTAYNATTIGNHSVHVTVHDTYLVVYINVYEYEGTVYVERANPVEQDITIDDLTHTVETYTVTDEWDDTMDENGEYVQSYFMITLPIMSFDLYACAAITQEMNIVMRGGACIGCTFPIQCDWEYYKTSFYDDEGNFAPYGSQRDYETFPDSSTQQITVIVQKDINTFGTLMPNVYQYPVQGDAFVITGISLPESYITNAEERLDHEMKSYMLENNIYYYDYPLKFDEYFLATHTYILNQIKPNTVVRFNFAGQEYELYIKQLSIKYGNSVLPEYSITLTDDVDVVMNQISQVASDVAHLSTTLSMLNEGYNRNVWAEIAKKLSRTQDDTAYGKLTFAGDINATALATLTKAFIGTTIGTSVFNDGFAGEGWQVDNLGNLTVDSLTVRQTMRVFELLIQQVRATGGEIIVSPANGKIKSVSGSGAIYTCTLEASSGFGNMFQMGDYVRCQQWSSKQVTVKSYWVQVIGVSGSSITLNCTGLSSPNLPEAGDEIVLMGSSITGRQGAISISATEGANLFESGKPRITILNGITHNSLNGCTRVVLGDLDGITDSSFPVENQPEGYGLYSDNVFLRGAFKMSSGTEIDNAKIVLQADKTTIKNLAGEEIAVFDSDGRLIVQDVESNRVRVYSNITRANMTQTRFLSASIGQGNESLLCYYYDNGVLMREDSQIIDNGYDDEHNMINIVAGYQTKFFDRDGSLLYSTQYRYDEYDPIHGGGETITYTYSWSWGGHYVIANDDPFTKLQEIYNIVQDSSIDLTNLNIGAQYTNMSKCTSSNPLINDMLVTKNIAETTGQYVGDKVFTGIRFTSNSATRISVGENRWSRTYAIYVGGLKQSEDSIIWQEGVIQ